MKLNRTAQRLNEIGVALSQERDTRLLLERIVAGARELLDCDAGSLYVVRRKEGAPEHPENWLDGKELFFRVAQNDSVSFSFREMALPITNKSIAGYVTLTGELLNIDDVYTIPPDTPYEFGSSFDEANHYRTVSMLTIPMKNRRGDVIGLLQVMNQRKNPGRPLGKNPSPEDVLTFEGGEIELAQSLAGQAAVALENRMLYDEIESLFRDFVHASVTAIESRDPTTSGHSERVGRYTVALAKKVDRASDGPFANVIFSRDDLRQIEFASVLHDFGKIGVREDVLQKAKKLYPHELERIENRSTEIRLRLRLLEVERKLEAYESGRFDQRQMREIEAKINADIARLDHDLELIRKANQPALLDENAADGLTEISKREIGIVGCDILTLLSDEEARKLGVRRGSLTEEERLEIESHVTHTYEYLKQIPWTPELRRVPDIAYGHHEKLNGKGYPRGLAGDAIPLESRMMTIADIFDALTAWDRPYKKAVPLPKALAILEDEAKRGAIDEKLLRVFIDGEVYKVVTPPQDPSKALAAHG